MNLLGQVVGLFGQKGAAAQENIKARTEATPRP